MSDTVQSPRKLSPPAEAWGLLRELPALLDDRIDLFVLELRLAGRALIEIVAWIIVAAICGVTTWLAAWGAVTLELIEWGWSPRVALLVVVLVNILVVVMAWRRIHGLISRVSAPLLHRRLKFSPETAHEHA